MCEFLDVDVELCGVLEKSRVKNHVFHIENVFITCKSRLAHLWALSAIPSLLELGLAHHSRLARDQRFLFSKSQWSDWGNMS